MGFEKDYRFKDLECRMCGTFLDYEQLKEGMCPDCGTDENLFPNELLDEEE